MNFTKIFKSKKTIFIILAVLVVAGGFAFWYFRDQLFSKEILKLEILGPDTATMGSEIQYTVKYQNNGNFVLQQPKLTFDLPDNSLTEDGKTRFTQDLNDLYPGEQESVSFKTRLLGKQGDVEVAGAFLSYIPKNLSARYESDTTFSTTINNVPVSLTFDVPSKAEKGKEISYDVNYFSNVDYPLENMSVKVDGVNGFNIESASPASLDNAEWKLDTLNKAQGGRITVKGLVIADMGTILNFSAHLGMWRDGSFIVIQDATQDVQVINPLLSISQQINSSDNYVASTGETLHYKISLQNIGTSPVDNVFVSSSLSGSAYDMSTVKSPDGQATVSGNIVTWDPKQISNLQHLEPGQQTSVAFDVTLKGDWTPSAAEKNNVVLKNTVNAAGISQEFDTKVNSNITVSQKAYHSDQSGFKNSGPVPPQVGQVTTYVVVWQVQNLLNDVKNVKVRAVLPQGVTLTAVLPESQIPNFSLDSASHEIVWSAGDLSAGTGAASAGPSVSFQVSLTPDASIQGVVANLIGKATVSGEDQTTQKTISSTAPPVNTDLPDDKDNSGGGVVQ